MPEKSTLPNYRWIKFTIEALEDPAIMQLCRATLGNYVIFYLMAGKSDAEGLLCISDKVYSLADIAWYLRMPLDETQKAINELCRAGLMNQDGSGYQITRFLSEQGPGDNEDRAKWRERQNKKRLRARGEKEPEKEKEEDAEGEVEVDIESHGDVTVTPPVPPPPPRASSLPAEFEIIQNYWKACNGRKLTEKQLDRVWRVITGEPDIKDWGGRWQDCVSVWRGIAEEHKEENWSKNNLDAVLELYPIPNLEERMQREKRMWSDKRKDAQRKAILKQYGLFEE